MSVLYHAIHGNGVGHLMRQLAIAQAMHARDPSLHQTIVTEVPLPRLIAANGVCPLILPRHDKAAFYGHNRLATSWSHRNVTRLLYYAVKCADPAITVFDTHFAAPLVRKLTLEDGRSTVLVLRAVKEAYLRHLTLHGLLKLFDAIIVPEDTDVWDATVSPDLRSAIDALSSVRCVGPIVRRVDPPAKRAEPPYALLMAGGGGYRDEVARLRRTIRRVWLHVTRRGVLLPALKVMDGLAASGDSDVKWTDDVHSLMAGADIVISPAGYNTVYEALSLGARLFVCNEPRGNEDQCVRVHAIAGRDGVASFRTDENEATIGDRLVALLASEAPTPARFNGAALAAGAIAAAAGLGDPPAPLDLGQGSVAALAVRVDTIDKRSETAMCTLTGGNIADLVRAVAPGRFKTLIVRQGDGGTPPTAADWAEIDEVRGEMHVDVVREDAVGPRGRP